MRGRSTEIGEAKSTERERQWVVQREDGDVLGPSYSKEDNKLASKVRKYMLHDRDAGNEVWNSVLKPYKVQEI